MRKIPHLARLLMLLAVSLTASVSPAAGVSFAPQDFSRQWAFVTNADATISATENAVLRRGDEVYRRVFLLKAVPIEVSRAPQNATEKQIRNFISHYRPPLIPYTSEKTARQTGREKFNCLEFAEDLVSQAASNHVRAEVIGIKFQGKLTGHACAGFPTSDGRMLYFDSTPTSGHVSHGAHQARVEPGKTYRRADGGEPAGGAQNLPVTQIIPVSQLTELAGSLLQGSDSVASTHETKLLVVGEQHLPVAGIDYAGPETFKVSAAQQDRWKSAAGEALAARASREEAQRNADRATAMKLAAKALEENKRLAAQGNAYGELRMGQRYLNGDGVAKDVFKARDYLQRAAEQGSQTAVDELNRLDDR